MMGVRLNSVWLARQNSLIELRIILSVKKEVAVSFSTMNSTWLHVQEDVFLLGLTGVKVSQHALGKRWEK